MSWVPGVSPESHAEELSPGVVVERRRLFEAVWFGSKLWCDGPLMSLFRNARAWVG
jgi:hypothetical protein